MRAGQQLIKGTNLGMDFKGRASIPDCRKKDTEQIIPQIVTTTVIRSRD